MRRFIAPLSVSYFLFQKRHVKAQTLPSNFRDVMESLNERDNKRHLVDLRKNIISVTPSQYHRVIERLPRDVLETLEYIRVVYEPPLSSGQKVRVRRDMMRLIEGNNDSNEHEYFLHLLNYYGCL